MMTINERFLYTLYYELRCCGFLLCIVSLIHLIIICVRFVEESQVSKIQFIMRKPFRLRLQSAYCIGVIVAR
jgi:hypothetical protein